jgi:Bacterial capsule synthesis protein PGA_cap
MLSRYVGIVAHAKGDPGWPLRDVSVLLSSADIAFANLESPFSDRGRVVDKGMIFKAEPAMIQALELAGIDIVSTANNHARDCGRYGVEYTLDWLEQHEIAAVGTAPTAEAARRGTVLDRNGIRFGFLAYTYDQSNGNHPDLDDRIAMMDARQIAGDVKSMLERADVAIVSMHAGVEYQRTPSFQQQEFAHAAIDAQRSGGASSARHAAGGKLRQGRDFLLAGQPGFRPVPADGDAARVDRRHSICRKAHVRVSCDSRGHRAYCSPGWVGSLSWS